MMAPSMSAIDEPKISRQASFTIISESEIEPKQKKMIVQVTETLGLEENIARALLLKFLWNKEKLIQDYMDNENLVR